MYKAGQILTINGKKYRITKCRTFEKCVLCKKQNEFIPCITYAAIVYRTFSMNECWTHIPHDCYLKQLNPSVSGK